MVSSHPMNKEIKYFLSNNIWKELNGTVTTGSSKTPTCQNDCCWTFTKFEVKIFEIIGFNCLHISFSKILVVFWDEQQCYKVCWKESSFMYCKRLIFFLQLLEKTTKLYFVFCWRVWD